MNRSGILAFRFITAVGKADLPLVMQQGGKRDLEKADNTTIGMSRTRATLGFWALVSNPGDRLRLEAAPEIIWQK